MSASEGTLLHYLEAEPEEDALEERGALSVISRHRLATDAGGRRSEHVELALEPRANGYGRFARLHGNDETDGRVAGVRPKTWTD